VHFRHIYSRKRNAQQVNLFSWESLGKKGQARACQNPAEIVHIRTARFIAVFGEHQKSKESEVGNVNPGHHETPVPAAGRVVFRGTGVGFSAASIANTAQHKLASPEARCACCFRKKSSKRLVKNKQKSVKPKISPCSRTTGCTSH
jgi:hypothetical protein